MLSQLHHCLVTLHILEIINRAKRQAHSLPGRTDSSFIQDELLTYARYAKFRAHDSTGLLPRARPVLTYDSAEHLLL